MPQHLIFQAIQYTIFSLYTCQVYFTNRNLCEKKNFFLFMWPCLGTYLLKLIASCNKIEENRLKA